MERQVKRQVIGLMALANLLAAYGTGSILRGGIKVIPEEYWVLRENTIFAFLVGTALGLFLMLAVSAGMKTAKWFSLGAAGAALILLTMVSNQSVAGPFVYVFFLLLCLRFSCWFLPRAFRLAQASQLKRLPLVESAYYVGTILGLVAPPDYVWKILGLVVPPESFVVVLAVDATLQCVAAGLDYWCQRVLERVPPPSPGPQPAPTPSYPPNRKYNLSWYIRMVGALTVLTVGCQILPFNLASAWISRHASAEKKAKELGEAIEAVASPQAARGTMRGFHVLAVFYVGVALSALACHPLKARLEWPGLEEFGRGFAAVVAGEEENTPRDQGKDRTVEPVRVPYLAIVLPSFGLVALAIMSYWLNWSDVLLLASVALGGALYEVLYLVLYPRILKETNREWTVRALGFMAFGSAVAWWTLHATKSPPEVWLAVLGLCAVVAVATVFYRRAPAPNGR